jgi:hypothetical protein
MIVELIGGGGGGGGQDIGYGGGGGGGGAYTKAFVSVTPGATYNINVGAFGAGGPNATYPGGVSGSISSLTDSNGNTLAYANGGIFGRYGGQGGNLGGLGGSNAGNPAVFASPGNAAATDNGGAPTSGPPGAGIAFVTNGQLFGAGGSGGNTSVGEQAGSSGTSGAVLLTF